jgi:hypothetical protein
MENYSWVTAPLLCIADAIPLPELASFDSSVDKGLSILYIQFVLK